VCHKLAGSDWQLLARLILDRHAHPAVSFHQNGGYVMPLLLK
jgi:hypothetical protein